MQIGELIVEILAGVIEEVPADRWREIVGDVEALPIVMHPRSNWRIAPKGRADEVDAAQRAAEVVRAEHPYIQP